MNKLSTLQQKTEQTTEQNKVELWEDEFKKRDFSSFTKNEEKEKKLWLILSTITMFITLVLLLYEMAY